MDATEQVHELRLVAGRLHVESHGDRPVAFEQDGARQGLLPARAGIGERGDHRRGQPGVCPSP